MNQVIYEMDITHCFDHIGAVVGYHKTTVDECPDWQAILASHVTCIFSTTISKEAV